MPFSNAPSNDTYSSPRVSVISDYQLNVSASSPTTEACGLTNILPFKNTQKNYGVDMYGDTRTALKTVAVTTGSGHTARGMYVWQKTTTLVYFYMVVSNGTNTQVYTSTTGLASSWTSVNTLPTNGTDPVRFTEFIDATNTKSLVMVDGIDGYVFTSNAAGTRIVDADFPTPHVPFPVFLDGYLFLAKAGTGDIYNSDLNTPSSWTAGSFISSELYPDDIQALIKINNYILAVGTQGCEYFYDAAIAIASPLARQEGATLPFGTIFPGTIAFNKDTVIMLANNNDGGSAFKIIEGMKHSDLEAQCVVPLISAYIIIAPAMGPTMRGTFLRQNGELFYVFNMSSGLGSDTAGFTFAWSPSTKIWVRLTAYGNSGPPRPDFGTQYSVFYTSSATLGNLYTYVAGHYNTAGTFFGYLDTSSSSDTFFGSTYQIYQRISVPEQDFGTMNLKTVSRLAIVMVRPFSTTTNLPTVAWCDTDDVALYTAPVSLAGSLKTAGGGFPFITQLGSFRSRRFQIVADYLTVSSVPTRWYAIEVDINKGQQ